MASGGEDCQDVDLRDIRSRRTQTITVGYSDPVTGVYTHIENATNVQLNGKMVVYMNAECGTKKKRKAKKPLTESTEPVTVEQMLDIKDRLGSDWKDLGLRLGFDDALLDQMHLDNKDNLCNLNYEILRRWKTSQPENATQRNLAKIFTKMFRGDLSDLLAQD